MSLTLREALTFGGLWDAEVIAGREHLDREIKSVSILEVADPMVSQWASSDELYISSLYSIPTNITAQLNVLRALASCGCTGLVIGHLGLWFDALDPSVVALCEELHFPLIAANPKRNYLEILNPIYRRIMHWNPDKNQQQSLRDDINHIIMNERNIYEALKKISVISNLPISFFDSKYNCIYSNKNEPDKLRDRQMLEQQRSYLDQAEMTKAVGNSIVVPVRLYDLYRGCIVMDADQKEGHFFHLADDLKLAYGFLLVSRPVAKNSHSEYLSEYLNRIIRRDFYSEESALGGASNLKIDIKKLRHLAVIQYIRSESETDEAYQLHITIFMWFYERLKTIIREYSQNNRILLREDQMIVFCEDFANNEYARFQGQLLNLFCSQQDITVSIGIAERGGSVLDFPTAYEEALTAARIGYNFYGANQFTAYNDVWVYGQLDKLKKDDLARRMAEKRLEKIMEADNKSNMDLAVTMRTLIECNDDITAAAKLLYVHRNTVVYRRGRIIELLGESPFEFPRKLVYYISLYIIQ